MAHAKTPPIIHLVGPAGSGKTTLCRMFLDAFDGKSVLVVDDSPDGYLSLSYGVQKPITMGDLLNKIQVSPLTREAMDWALQDLPVAIASESDAEILTWGNMPEPLSDVQRDLLSYGLPRLFGHYDVVIWDGAIGVPKSVLHLTDVRHLIVITPNDEAYCQKIELPKAMVLLSKANATDILPATAASEIQKGNWSFLGKLPPLNPPEKRVKELPRYFQECFHKLDLPFELRSHHVS